MGVSSPGVPSSATQDERAANEFDYYLMHHTNLVIFLCHADLFKYPKLKFSVVLKNHTTWLKSIPHGQKVYHMVILYACSYIPHITYNSIWYATNHGITWHAVSFSNNAILYISLQLANRYPLRISFLLAILCLTFHIVNYLQHMICI